MGRSILRDGDERGEKIVSEFLDKHFYIECEDFIESLIRFNK